MKTCTTHHPACDCREAAHKAEIERLNELRHTQELLTFDATKKLVNAETKLSVAQKALEGIQSLHRLRGYPTGIEWYERVFQPVEKALAEIENK